MLVEMEHVVVIVLLEEMEVQTPVEVVAEWVYQ